MRLCISTIVTSTRGGQLECLNSEGEVAVVRVIHQEPAKEYLYNYRIVTLGFFKWGNFFYLLSIVAIILVCCY